MLPIRDTIPSRHLPLMTWMLVLVNGAVFLFELGLSGPALEQVFYFFGIVPARYTHPIWAEWVGLRIDTYWPFLTSMFLHGGWIHIVGNMWMLWIFGDNVEDRMGSFRFLTFYLFCGLVAGIVHLFSNPDSTVPTVGASGAIAGVMGAYFLLFPRSRIIALVPVFFWPVFVQVPAILYLGFWFLMQLYGAALILSLHQDVGGVAWWAHVGGFAAGVLLHRFFIKRRGAYQRLGPDAYRIKRAWGRFR